VFLVETGRLPLSLKRGFYASFETSTPLNLKVI
jgi:hypothetical protein